MSILGPGFKCLRYSVHRKPAYYCTTNSPQTPCTAHSCRNARFATSIDLLLLLEYSVVYEYCYDKATYLNQILENSEQPSILQNLDTNTVPRHTTNPKSNACGRTKT